MWIIGEMYLYLASDGSEALSVMEKESIDLVITDIQMPGVNGFELMKAIKEGHPELPVIIITGYAEIELAAQAVNEGASAFLQKPIMFSELDAKIEEAYHSLLEHRQVQQELKTLQQTAEERQQQLENAQAFSVSILNNISRNSFFIRVSFHPVSDEY